MSDSSRDKRLGSGTKLLGAVQALDKVGKDHRAEYLHDRLISAIDSICEERQGSAVKPHFSAAQLEIIKDVSFHIVYILHHKPDKKPGIVKSVWNDYCAQGPVKMISLGVGALAFIGLAIGFIVVQAQNYRSGGVDAVWASFFSSKDAPDTSPRPALSPRATQAAPRAPSLTQPSTPVLPIPTIGIAPKP